MHLFAELGLSGPIITRCTRIAEEDSISTSCVGSHRVLLISQVFMSGYEICQDLSGRGPLVNNSSKFVSALEKVTPITAIAGTSRTKETLHSHLSVSTSDIRFHEKLGILSAVQRMSLGVFDPKMDFKNKAVNRSSLNSRREMPALLPCISVENDRMYRLYLGLGLGNQTYLNPKSELWEDIDEKKKDTPRTRRGGSNIREGRVFTFQTDGNNNTPYETNYIPRKNNPFYIEGSDSSDGTFDQNYRGRNDISDSGDNECTTSDCTCSMCRDAGNTSAKVTKETLKATDKECSKISDQDESTICALGHCIVNGDVVPESKALYEAMKDDQPKGRKNRRWLWFVLYFIQKIFCALLVVLKYVLGGSAMALGLCEMFCLALYRIYHYVIVVPIYNWTRDTVPWLMSPAEMEAFVLPTDSDWNRAYTYQPHAVEEDDDDRYFRSWLLGEDEQSISGRNAD